MKNSMPVFLRLSLTILFIVSVSTRIFAQIIDHYEGPIIDMHLHGYNQDDYWGGRIHPSGLPSPETAKEHLRQTLEYMSKYNIVKAVIDGNSLKTIQSHLANNENFIPGYSDWESLPDIEQFEELIKNGTIKVFGEVSAVYKGKTLNDPIYEPYLRVCEKYGIPVAYLTEVVLRGLRIPAVRISGFHREIHC